MSEASALDRDPLPPVSVTRLQLCRELKARDLWAAFQVQLAQDPDLAEEWGLAVSLKLRDPVVENFAQGMGMAPGALEDLFREAAKR